MIRAAGHLVLAVVLAVSVRLDAWIICVGPDGHRAIERAGSECCGSGDHADAPDRDPHCAHGCVDVPVVVSAGYRTPAQASSSPSGAALPYAAPSSAGGLMATASTRAWAEGPPPRPPRSERTTRHLC